MYDTFNLNTDLAYSMSDMCGVLERHKLPCPEAGIYCKNKIYRHIPTNASTSNNNNGVKFPPIYFSIQLCALHCFKKK